MVDTFAAQRSGIKTGEERRLPYNYTDHPFAPYRQRRADPISGASEV